jgi:uncharacterized membrane protein YdbT with pleckstrin-like domain
MPDIFSANKKDSLKTKKPHEIKDDITEVSSSYVQGVKTSSNPLSSFIYNPKKAQFVNEDPEEKIILIVRAHPITNLNWIITTFIFFLTPAILFVIPPFDTFPSQYQYLLSLVIYLFTVTFAFQRFLDWFFHVNIITDERIIEVDFFSLIHREITDANIDRIEDVTTDVGGLVRTFFNYGDIYIQTSAEVPRIDFEAVPQPDKIAMILRALRVEEEKEKLEGRVR